MKLRWKITLGLAALAVIGAVLLFGTPSGARRDLEATRRALRQQGFKLDLSEFDLSTSPELRKRAAMLATTTRAELANSARQGPILRDRPGLMTPVGANAAMVIWKQERLNGFRGDDLWPELRESLNANQARLDAAVQAALSGPIRFEPIGTGPSALLPYLADLKNLETAFGMRAMLALHDGSKAAAWTNLLAATCLATEYAPEPLDISHLVRFACATIAGDTAWNVLQSGDWSDAQLADLQRRWQSADFWTRLPETAAYARANMAMAFELERRDPLGSGMTISEALRSPKYVWPWMKGYGQRLSYRRKGMYEDENGALLHYRNRELELRRAIQSPNWSEMRGLPGVTNQVLFSSTNSSRTLAMMRIRHLSMSFQGGGQGSLGRAAEAEARRRLVVTAIALERHRGRHGSYPGALSELVPELLAAPPTDFMDGQPLHYRRTDDGHFVLYSVGLDCVDNGGQMRDPRARRVPREFAIDPGLQQGRDLVWPRPASVAEVEGLQEEESKARREQLADVEEMQAAYQWGHTAKRQKKADALLKAPPRSPGKEPVWRGRPLAGLLRNPEIFGTNQPALADVLTLRQVITGDEPETITFELPVHFDALARLGALQLYIDPTPDEDSDEGCNVGRLECKRAANGDCLLVWSTLYEAPGQHALQAGLDLHDLSQAEEEISGPLVPFVITNLCQFSLSSAHFERPAGVTLHARLPEPNANYVIELKSLAGNVLRTISGSTTNRVLKEHWDLKDDRGNVCTNDEFGSVFHLTLPDSGRSQTLKGP